MIKWYNNTDDKLKFNKSPVLIATDDTSIIYGDVSILSPVLKCKSYSGNYVFIDVFNRYYFITDVIYSKGYYYVKCAVDAYYSFYNETQNVTVNVVRNEYEVDNNIIDNAMMLKAHVQLSSENFGETISYDNDVPYIIGVI